MLALGIRYLTGYAVATDVSDRERAEWPPHPARVFMAVAAAHFETGQDPAERDALEWLEGQGPPAIRASEAFRREVVTHYVPVNDSTVPDHVKGDAKLATMRAVLGVLPQHRSRRPRTFPRARPHDDAVYLLWRTVTPDAACLAALDRLCSKVIRIGHSSSFVQMWVESTPPEPSLLPDATGTLRLRVAGQGTLEYLRSQFNADAIQGYAELNGRLGGAEGKVRSALRRERDAQFPGGEPTTQRPAIGLWEGYRQAAGPGDGTEPVSGLFDRKMMVLALQDGPAVGLETTWQLLTALRDAILTLCEPTPEWVSGHQPDGSPSKQAHLALLPLPFVGHAHADGHLLGVALAFPKGVAPRERGIALRKLLHDDTGAPRPIDLKLGIVGSWRLTRETREPPPLALQGLTWTGPSHSWATVTPIVLDRHPKADYRKERARWLAEVTQVIAESCRRQGLPAPVDVDVDTTCWHRGGPRATPGQGGFALMPTKPGQPTRQQVHAWLRFGREVEGPLLLGAGRYRGYGVCKPWYGGCQ